MNEDKIQIRGNRDGINAIIDMESFDTFDQMLDILINKLTIGKNFYKGSVLKITGNFKNVNDVEIARLKDALFQNILIKECIFEELDTKEQNKGKIFNGVYEGKTKFIKKTIRSGQQINYVGNIVIIGDINNGAEVYAGGNIIVLGSTKGKVYAGVGGNEQAIICSFSLQPEILKIADIITVAPEDGVKPKYPELAKIKDGMIVVEPYLVNKYIY